MSHSHRLCVVFGVICWFGAIQFLSASDQESSPFRALTEADAKRAQDLQRQIDEFVQADKYPEAAKVVEELLLLRQRGQGEKHWETVSVRWQKETLQKVAVLSAAQRADWRTSIQRERDAREMVSKGKLAEALPILQQLLKLRREVLGEGHPDVAASYNDLAYDLDAKGQFAAAAKLHEQALAIKRKTLGDDHPDTALAYTNRGINLANQGRWAEAEPLLQRSLVLYLRLRGDEHADTALAYNNLAFNHASQGRYAEAAPLFERALAIYRHCYGEKHASVALALNNLAMVYDSEGRTAEAEPLLQTALATYRETLGEDHPDTILASNNVAMNLNAQGKLAEAQPLLRKALDASRRISGEEHPETLRLINNVAFNLSSQEKYAEAGPLYQKAFAAYRRVLGVEHPATLQVANNVAMNLNAQGRFAEAESMLRASLSHRRRLLGDEHPDTALSTGNLALNLAAQGKYDEATNTAAAAVKSYEAVRLRFGSTGLERSALADSRLPHHFLTAWLARAGRGQEAWQVLEQHLARGLLDELSVRGTSTRSAKEIERARVLRHELAKLDQQLAVNAIPMDAAAKESHEAALRKKQQLRAELAQLDAAWALTEVCTFNRLQEKLSADTAFLAWIDVRGDTHAADPNGEHWACMVKHSGPPHWVKLPGTGPGGKWTKEDDLAAEAAVNSLSKLPEDSVATPPALERLYRQRLAPLEKQLEGVKRLLVCPAGWMVGIPVEALTDRYVVSYVPSGSVFTRLEESRPKQSDPFGKVLAVGDPIYQPTVTASAREAERAPRFAPLPGTRREVEALAAIFTGQATLLTGDGASEQRLRDMAARDELRRFRYVHFATHGVLDNRRLLQTALILSQDRLPDSAHEVVAGRKPLDGRLTAQEILDNWKLDANLVTLSACQSGLGRTGGGDGYIGFPQVLLLTGARSVVLSLWQVNDAATSLLMVRFYQNLLGKRQGLDKPLPKAEALREAKQWLRKLTRANVEKQAAHLPEAVRGLKLERSRKLADSDCPFAHPYYWASFILTGDPH